MAEIFGIISGAVGIASVFSTCVEVFEYVRIGRDYETSQLRLTTTCLRLLRWGTAVNVLGDPDHLGRPTASEDEVNHARSSLVHILRLFEQSSKVSVKFSSNAVADVSNSSESAALALHHKMGKMVSRHHGRGPSLTKLTRWAISDRNALNELIEHITKLVDGLEKLFPPPEPMVNLLLDEEVKEVHGQEERRALLDAAANGVDEALSKAVSFRVTGHRYKSVDIAGIDNGTVMNGNLMSEGFNGSAAAAGFQGSSHAYDGVKISGSGVKVLNGNQ